jgi:uncharacterized protein
MIIRKQTDNIVKLLSFNPVVGILGPRQVGKTTLAKALKRIIKKETIMLDMENPDDYSKLNDALFYLRNYNDYCVIIDEIQRKPELFSLLRVLVDEYRKPGRFIILGSASPRLIKGSSESLAGRISFVELSPFDICEIKSKFIFTSHWFYGGFPEPYILRKKSDSLKWLSDFITTYIERDLPGFGLVTTSQTLRRFWTMLASSQGGIWNASSFAKSLGISPPTISRYLEFLEGVFIVRKLYPFFVNIKKQLVKSPKIYIRDSGILHRLLSINDYKELINNKIAGFSFEGYVVEQLSAAKNHTIDMNYYRTKDGAECDIIFSKAQRPVACAEIKFSNSPDITRSLNITMNDLDIKEAFIITPAGDNYKLTDNIITCSVFDFVTKYLPLIK